MNIIYGVKWMGEKIKNISTINIGKEQAVIELNHAYSLDYKYDIHIQTKSLQLSLKDGDFIKLAAAIRFAKKELKRSKKHVKSRD